MSYSAKNMSIKLGDAVMDYAVFGKGDKALVMLPGLGLKGVKGSAASLSYMYRVFAKDYTVYVFDKICPVPLGITLRDMARDTALAMRALGIEHADVFGVSQGGMIAQYLAVDYPDLVGKLVLGVTLARENETVNAVVNNWIDLAERGEMSALVEDMLPKMYSDAYMKKYKLLLPLLAKTGASADRERFIALAKACLGCEVYGELDKLKCPVLVLGGKKDRVVTGEASEEIAQKLGCEIHMYGELGHAVYEEAKDFNSRILEFLKK